MLLRLPELTNTFSHVHVCQSSLYLYASVSSSKNILPPNVRSPNLLQRYANTQTHKCIHRTLAHTCMHTHTGVLGAQTQSPMGLPSAPRNHTFAHTITHRALFCTYTYTQSPKATGPALPVACTMHSLGVRGCTPGRRRWAGRTPAGMDQDPSILWPSRTGRSWHPIHSPLCSRPAEKQGLRAKPPWPTIGHKG